MRDIELIQPMSLAEAISLLGADDSMVRPISGGTALMLMMKSGVFTPRRLVSLARVEDEHRTISIDADGSLRIGALSTLSAIAGSSVVSAGWSAISAVMPRLSNVRVRNAARIGGTLAHGDPHMDLPPLLAALGAEVTIRGAAGERRLPVAALYRGYYETALEPGELITAVTVPAMAGARAAYVKATARSADDWPALGVSAWLRLGGDTVREARLVLSAATAVPTRLHAAEAVITGEAVTAGTLARAAEAARSEVELLTDAHGSAAYKRELLGVFLRRAIHAVLENRA